MKLPAVGGEGYGVLTLASDAALPHVQQLWRTYGDRPQSDEARAAFAAHGITYAPCPGLTKAAAELPEVPPELRWGEPLGIGFASFRED